MRLLMHRRTRVAFLAVRLSFFLLGPMLLLYGFIVYAQDLQHPKYRFQVRLEPERREGLKPLDIAGEKLDLMAVLLTADGAGQQPDRFYRLGFYLPEAEPQVHIAVRDYQAFPNKYHYWMLPARRRYDRGFQEFSWEATLVQELGLGPDALGVVARLGGSGDHIVVPLLLSATPFPAKMQVRGCRFIFLPNETMDVEYTLYPKGNASQVMQQGKAQWDKKQRQTIVWSGKDRQGKGAPAGWYAMKLTATLTPAGKPREQLPSDWTFYYTPELSVQR